MSNLNRQDYSGSSKGSTLRAGRGWCQFEGERSKSICLEWYFFKKGSCHIGFSIDDEDWTFKFAMPFLFSFYLSFQGFKFLYKISPKIKRKSFCNPNETIELIDERECSISVHDGAIYIYPWKKMNEWNRDDPWYVKGISLYFKDFIMGQLKMSEKDICVENIAIPMPERTYEATTELKEQTRWRSRFPFSLFKRKNLSAWVDIPSGIPFPGKGENGWDCGMDGLFGTGVHLDRPYHCSYDLRSSSIAAVVRSVYRNREKYGCKNWVPSERDMTDWFKEKTNKLEDNMSCGTNIKE